MHKHLTYLFIAVKFDVVPVRFFAISKVTTRPNPCHPGNKVFDADE